MAAGARHRDSSARILREIILDHLNRHIGKTSYDLKQDVIDDYGSISARRNSQDRLFLGHLAILIRAGCIRRDEEYDLEIGQMRPVYFLVTKEIPPPPPRHCRHCGLIGASSRGHRSGHVKTLSKIRKRKIQLAYAPGFSPAERPASARTPDPVQPAGSADQPDRPRRAARRER